MKDASETIVCRARLDEECLHGQPMSVQMPGEDEPVTMAEDGLYDGTSIVCDACYYKLIPLTPSQAGLRDELPEAINVYRGSLAYVREHPNPLELVEQASASREKAKPGSPYYESATAMQEMAQAEVDRRAKVATR